MAPPYAITVFNLDKYLAKISTEEFEDLLKGRIYVLPSSRKIVNERLKKFGKSLPEQQSIDIRATLELKSQKGTDPLTKFANLSIEQASAA